MARAPRLHLLPARGPHSDGAGHPLQPAPVGQSLTCSGAPPPGPVHVMPREEDWAPRVQRPAWRDPPPPRPLALAPCGGCCGTLPPRGPWPWRRVAGAAGRWPCHPVGFGSVWLFLARAASRRLVTPAPVPARALPASPATRRGRSLAPPSRGRLSACALSAPEAPARGLQPVFRSVSHRERPFAHVYVLPSVSACPVRLGHCLCPCPAVSSGRSPLPA